MLELDEIDIIILKMIQENPLIKQVDIARKTNRSQPAIGERCKRLKKEGILNICYGIDVKKLGMLIAKVEVEEREPEKLEGSIKDCPHMIYFWRQSGTFNFSVLMVGNSLKEIVKVIDHHFNNKRTSFNIVSKINNSSFPIKFTNKCECDK
jgi:DNA-binding Lrp family transcriptional regulator